MTFIDTCEQCATTDALYHKNASDFKSSRFCRTDIVRVCKLWGSLCVCVVVCAHGRCLFLWLQLCVTVFRNEPDYITLSGPSQELR